MKSVVLTLAALVLALAWLLISHSGPRVPPGLVQEPQLAGEIRSGTELTLIFIASSTCAAATFEGFETMIDRMKVSMRREARRRGLMFSTVGVSLDRSIEEGLDFLGKFGPFDEIIVGRTWINTAAVLYLWRDHPGKPSIPQVVILERDLVKGKNTITIERETLVARKVGLTEIARWEAQGFGL